MKCASEKDTLEVEREQFWESSENNRDENVKRQSRLG